MVSIHAPAWGATAIARRDEWHGFSFNPRTRMGCDFLDFARCHIFRCFNPRTRMGCDGIELRLQAVKQGFNPRTRMGCDRILSNELNIIVQIYRICE